MAAGAALLLLVLATLRPVNAQSPGGDTYPQGLPHPVMHYDPDATPSERQVWDIAQDSSHVLYIAGSHRGVQMFDGEHWLTIPIDSTDEGAAIGTARSLALGHDGRMYAGTNDDIGVLVPGEKGRLTFRSLLPRLREQDRRPDVDGTGTVWFAGATDQYTYFQTQRAIYRWDGSALDVWRSDDTFHTTHLVDGRLFVRDFERGLLELVGGTLRPIPGGASFENRAIHFLALHPSGGMIAVTATAGVYLLNESGARPTSVQADSILRTTRVYSGASIAQDGGEPLYALATLGRGVVVMDPEGSIVYHLRPGQELPDGVVNTVHSGRDGETWIGFNNEGIMRFGGLPNVEHYGERSGLRGQVEAVTTFDDQLFVGTGSGLFRMREQSSGNLPDAADPFQRVRGSSVVNGLEVTRRGLVVDDLSRTWMLRTGEEPATLIRRNAHALFVPSSMPDRLLISTMRGGLTVVRNEGGTWRTERSTDLDATPHSLAEFRGEIWGATDPHTVLRFSVEDIPELTTARHLSVDPATAVEGFSLTVADERLLLISRSGVYTWDETSESFEPAPDLVPDGDGPVRTFLYTPERGRADAWIVKGTRLFAGKRTSTSPVAIDWTPVPGLSFRVNETVRLHEAPSGDLWIGRGDDLLRYRPTSPADSPLAPSVLVRRVLAGPDETVVRGSHADPGSVLSISYAMNSLVVQFAAPRFDAETPALYRTRLLGESADWSNWSRRAEIDLPGLREDTYRLQVQARTIDGIVSETETLQIIVAPPWYRSRWAYIGYVLLGLVGLASIWRYRVAVRRRRKAEAKTTRTEEKLQAEQQLSRRLARANERLREVNRMKEYFMANTSHELRTPLTNIIGFARLLQDEAPNGMAPHLEVIENNGYRLLHTLNAILDLAGLRARTMQPMPEWIDIRDPVHDVMKDLTGEAERKDLAVESQIPTEPVYAYLDRYFVERVVHHLVDNAIKFTATGHINVSVWEDENEVGIAVEDTGIGIDAAFIPDLFISFEQQSQGMDRAYEGSGIGLAVTGQLVEALGGQILVDSEQGVGTRFQVLLSRDGRLSGRSDRTNGSISASTSAE
ncbi:MAG: hypothetical protein GVY25_16510 [Bacteroidetes bacterium]|jgi:signal transduction histidine kinase|nr:hypothetical protein [Bacteroidota bacterium]